MDLKKIIIIGFIGAVWIFLWKLPSILEAIAKLIQVLKG
jgi:hypothetical protein